jgi:hypothetical protein
MREQLTFRKNAYWRNNAVTVPPQSGLPTVAPPLV